MSVNDLPNQWRKMLNRTDAGYYSMTVCADELEDSAKNLWHPVSEPPTEEDADEFGDVVISDGRVVHMVFWGEVSEMILPGTRWAKIRDVVLLPED